MNGYTKLFASIIASTIWREDKATKIVWITMLAMANKNGVVEASIPGLADMARVTIEECENALSTLSKPDRYSRTKDHEGRRIQACDGGWMVLNHAKYRQKLSDEERREYLRIKKKESRERLMSTQCQQSLDMSTMSTQAKAKAKAEAFKGGTVTIEKLSTPTPTNGPMPPSVRIGKEKEYERALKAITQIENQYDSHERMSAEHVKRRRELRSRCAILRTDLGIEV